MLPLNNAPHSFSNIIYGGEVTIQGGADVGNNAKYFRLGELGGTTVRGMAEVKLPSRFEIVGISITSVSNTLDQVANFCLHQLRQYPKWSNSGR